MRNESLTPDPSPKGEGSRMKNGVGIGLPSGWKFLTSHSSLLTNKKTGQFFREGVEKYCKGQRKALTLHRNSEKRAQQNQFRITG